jgi:TP901 family phage tail tape measure protein
MPDRFVFDAELLLHSNGEQFVREVRTIFRQLEAEARRLISQGSQAGLSGVPAQYAAGLGQVAAFIQRKPLLTERQQALATGSLRGAEATYGQLQNAAVASGLNLPGLAGLQASYQTGSRLLESALTRQSNAILQAAKAADEAAVAERRAALTAGRVAAGVPTTRPLPNLNLNRNQQSDLLGALSGGGITRASLATAYEAQTLQVRTQTAREQSTSQQYLRAKAEAAVAERQRSIAVARATREEALAQGGGQGTLFQRLQYAIHARSGLTDTRLPEDFQSFGQFFTSKALTTGGFALSGAILFGAISGFREIIREASALQRELAVVKSQFDALGDTRGFQEFSREVVDISVQTGIAADEVARVARQLAGVFRDQNTGLPDFNKSLSETQQALKLSQVTGLPFQEITDSLTAITVTFGTSFTKIGDLAIGLERRFGVLAPELIRFTADVAPVAKELGFTVDQITALGAIAQQRSGVSGGALAENFNRALPAIQQTQIALSQLLAQRPETEPFIKPILEALSSAKGADALGQLTKAYGVMNQAQRQALGELLGGQRNAKAFFAILQGGQDTIDALAGKTGDFSGALEQRFSDFQSTVEFAFERARRALEQFGLALFNSGLADGLKLVADSAALVAKFAGQLLTLFSKFNDVLGGMPVKLLAVYATLRLISALGGGIGGFRNLFANITARGATGTAPAAVPFGFTGSGAAASTATGAAQAFRFGIPLGSAGASLAASPAIAGVSGAIAALGPVIALTSIAAVVQTVAGIQQEVDASRKSLQDDVRGKLQKGLSPEQVLAYVKSNYSNEGFGLTFAGHDVPGQGDSRDDTAIDTIQKANAERQGKELAAILKTVDEQQAQKLLDAIGRGQPSAHEQLVGGHSLDAKSRLQSIVADFTNDPTQQANNDAVARLIALAASGGASPETVAQLQAIAAQYQAKIDAAAQLQNVADYAPVLEEVKARYDAGTAGLEELVAAERKNIDILKGDLQIVTGDARVLAAQQLANAQKELDGILTAAASRAADLLIKIGSARGGNVANLTLLARTQQLQALIHGGASPSAQLDVSLSILDAQSKQLDQFVNSPVIVNGIARAPLTAEKLARAAQGLDVSPELRQVIIRASLLINKSAELTSITKATGTGQDQIIDAVQRVLIAADRSGIDALKKAIDGREANLRRELTNSGDDPDERDAVRAALRGLEQAKAALDSLPAAANDPGAKITEDTTDLQNQAAIDASQEAQALSEALANKDRALAHGDPVQVAQAAVRAAQAALNRARASGKPSEIENAQAQLIDAQNQLDDANAQVAAAFISLAASTTHDPVKKAMFELDAANKAVADAHGAAAQYEALARQMTAKESVAAALTSVFQAQQNLLAAVDTAAGDTVGAAKEQLRAAQQQLDQLVARDLAHGDDPNNDPDVINARAAVVNSQANVRDTQLRKQESDIDIALQLERITTGQAIAQLQALLQIPKLTTEQTNEILLKIKQLQNDLGRDLQFNLPSEIRVPTAYEVRRIAGAGATPNGPNSYQDNRQIDVRVYAQTGASPSEIGTAVADAIGPTRVNGTYPRRYGG